MRGTEDVEAEKRRGDCHEESITHPFIVDMGGEVEECEYGECPGHVDGMNPSGHSQSVFSCVCLWKGTERIGVVQEHADNARYEECAEYISERPVRPADINDIGEEQCERNVPPYAEVGRERESDMMVLEHLL